MHSAEYGIFVKKLLWDVAFCAGAGRKGLGRVWGRVLGRVWGTVGGTAGGKAGGRAAGRPAAGGHRRRSRRVLAEPKRAAARLAQGVRPAENRKPGAAGFGVFRRNLPILGENLRVLDESCGNFYLCKGVTALPFFAQFSNNTQNSAYILPEFICLFMIYLQISSCFSW